MKRVLLGAGALCVSIISILAEPTTGKNYSLNFTDVDDNALSTADGRTTTILVLTSKANTDRARTVGDRTPEFCLGNSSYRMVTVVSFEAKHGAAVRAVLRAAIRHRLDSEARRLQVRYDQAKIGRDARRDVSAVADFDGTIAGQLDLKTDAALFDVFVFGKNGELLKQWSEVPTAAELVAVLKTSD